MNMFKLFGKDEIDEILDIQIKLKKISIEEILFKLKSILIKFDR